MNDWSAGVGEIGPIAVLTAAVAMLLIVLALGSTFSAIWLWRQKNAISENWHRAKRRSKTPTTSCGIRCSRRPVRGGTAENPDAVSRAWRPLPRRPQMRPSLALRNEAIACMGLADLRTATFWQGTLTGVDEATRVVAFDSQLARYARLNEHGQVSIRRVGDDSELVSLQGAKVRPRHIQFSPDDRLVAVVDAQKRLRVWNTQQGKAVFESHQPISNIAIDFSPDSRLIALGDEKEKAIRVYDLATGKDAHDWMQKFKHIFCGSTQRVRSLPSAAPIPASRKSSSGKRDERLDCRNPLDSVAWRGMTTAVCWPPEARSIICHPTLESGQWRSSRRR